jgi:putative zinc finger/helix-turn-helix YgiT family protein
MTAFCEECRDFVGYEEKDEIMTKSTKGKEYTFSGKVAYCEECGSEIHVAKLRDYNLNKLNEVYRTTEELVTVDQILRITDIYDIGKRPLSNLLGWGELTVSRYINGDIPSKQYSEVLKQILNNKEFYSKLLESEKGRISEQSYKKSKAALEGIIDINRVTYEEKIENVVNYLIKECKDVTPLALQKLLYYAQSFNKTFNEEFLYASDCEAWVHGPVYRNIYEKYRHYSYNPIELVENSVDFNLEENEKELLDSIIVNFGCYSGSILEKMTHIETPWRITRKGLKENELSNRIINKELIAEYFSNIKDKYNMLNLSDIRDYSADLFSKIKN